MIQISAAIASPTAAPRAAPAAVAAGASEFAVALATVLTPGAAAEAGELLLPGRQALAACGKKLPGLDGKPGEGEADKEEGEKDASDATFAWFAAPVAAAPARTGFSQAAQPAPRPIPLSASPDASTTGAQPALEATKAPGAEGASSEDGAPAAIKLPAQPATRASISIAAPADVDPKPVLATKAEPAQPAVPAPAVATPAVEVALDVPALANRPVATPPVLFPLDTPAAPRRQLREIVGATFAPTAPDAAAAPAIAAPADMQQAALDTRRHEWMGSMIDRIETMRDAAATGDTRIRLAPAALGQVDISIRQEGDRVHVHFATETQAARQLLTDAQPRLNELAEARGVKLGQTSVDSGAAGSGQQNHAAPRQEALLRPAGAVAAEAAADTDQRVA